MNISKTAPIRGDFHLIESHQLIVTIRCDVTIEQFEPDEKSHKDYCDVYM